MAATTFQDLIGGEFQFFGVDNNAFKIGDRAFEAIEDESDGYRSMLDEVREVPPSGLIFFAAPLATVRVEEDDTLEDSPFSGYRLRDVATGHVWLRFGTGNSGDYYPYFVFEYTPPTDTL